MLGVQHFVFILKPNRRRACWRLGDHRKFIYNQTQEKLLVSDTHRHLFRLQVLLGANGWQWPLSASNHRPSGASQDLCWGSYCKKKAMKKKKSLWWRYTSCVSVPLKRTSLLRLQCVCLYFRTRRVRISETTGKGEMGLDPKRINSICLLQEDTIWRMSADIYLWQQCWEFYQKYGKYQIIMYCLIVNYWSAPQHLPHQAEHL